MNNIQVYNHIIETIRPSRGQQISDIKMSMVLNVIQKDFDLYDTLKRELYCPEYFFIFNESLAGEFFVQFTCGDGFHGTLEEFFNRFEFISIKEEEEVTN